MHGYSLLRPSLNQKYFYELFDLCNQFRVPIEGLHTETGPGVFEVALAFDGTCFDCFMVWRMKKLQKSQIEQLFSNCLLNSLARCTGLCLALWQNRIRACLGQVAISIFLSWIQKLAKTYSHEKKRTSKQNGRISKTLVTLADTCNLFPKFYWRRSLAGVLDGLPDVYYRFYFTDAR